MPEKIAAYVRVSSAEQAESGYSLDAQSRIIRAYCEAHGWPEPMFYADAGRSAYTDITAKRPQFAAMLDAAESGQHDTIIVHRLDRFARSILVTLRELQRLEKSKVGFVSINEQMEFHTPIGRVILATLAAFSEYYSANLSREVKKGIIEKQSQGLHVGGIPWGAQRVAGRLVIDPATADTLALLLTLSRDMSAQSVAIELTRRGIPPPKAANWWPESIRLMIARGAWLAAQPAPWPDRWRQAAGRPRMPRFADSTRKAYPLSGLLRCACGGSMQYAYPWTRLDGVRTHVVRCRRRGARPERFCPGGKHTNAAVYEAQVDAAFLALPNLADAVRLPGGDDGAARQQLAARRQSLVLALAEGLPVEQYRQQKAALDREEARLVPANGQLLALLEEIDIAQKDWGRVSPAGKNRIWRLLFKEAIVTGATVEVVPSAALGALLAALDCST